MKRKNGRLLAILLAGILALSGCAGNSTELPPATQHLAPNSSPTNTLVVQSNVTLSPSEMPRISPEELKARLESGESILVVDARSSSHFEARHIPAAKSVPLDEVSSRLDEFPRDREVVFYCT